MPKTNIQVAIKFTAEGIQARQVIDGKLTDIVVDVVAVLSSNLMPTPVAARAEVAATVTKPVTNVIPPVKNVASSNAAPTPAPIICGLVKEGNHAIKFTKDRVEQRMGYTKKTGRFVIWDSVAEGYFDADKNAIIREYQSYGTATARALVQVIEKLKPISTEKPVVAEKPVFQSPAASPYKEDDRLLYCSVCNVEITSGKVLSFSFAKFGKYVCYDCQRKIKHTVASEASNLSPQVATAASEASSTSLVQPGTEAVVSIYLVDNNTSLSDTTDAQVTTSADTVTQAASEASSSVTPVTEVTLNLDTATADAGIPSAAEAVMNDAYDSDDESFDIDANQFDAALHYHAQPQDEEIMTYPVPPTFDAEVEALTQTMVCNLINYNSNQSTVTQNSEPTTTLVVNDALAAQMEHLQQFANPEVSPSDDTTTSVTPDQDKS